MNNKTETPGVIDITQLEVDARDDISKLNHFFEGKSFTMSQLSKHLFRGDRSMANTCVEHLNMVGGLISENKDGTIKYRIIADIEERKKNIDINISELEEFIQPHQAHLGMLKILRDNMDKI